MKNIQKILSGLLIVGSLLSTKVIGAPRTRRAGQASTSATKPRVNKPAQSMKASKPRLAADKWVDQHAANRFTHVATYLLNLKKSTDPQDRAKVAEHIRLIAAALEEKDPKKAKEELKAVPRLGRVKQTVKSAAKPTSKVAAKIA